MDNNLSYTLRLKDYFSKGIKGATNEVKGLDTGVNKLQSSLSKVGTGIASYFAVSSITQFGKSVVDSLSNYESFSASLRTLMYGDALAAKALENQLVSLAARTPFSLVDVQEGSKQLLAYGFSAGKVVENMEMLGDISAAVGKPLNELVYLYGTLRTQGRAFTKDINQFTTAGINLLPQLAKQFGTTEDKVKDLVETGKVGFKDVETAFKAMTKEGGQFFGMMAVQAKTVGGQLSNLGDNWEQLKVSIGKSQSGIISGVVNWSNILVGEMSRVMIQANRMDEAFANMKIEPRGFMRGFMETLNPFLKSMTGGLFGGNSKLQNLDIGIQSIVGKSSQNELEALKARTQLTKLQASYADDLVNKKIKPSDYKETSALIQSGLNQVLGNLKLFKNPQSNLATAAQGENGGTITPTKVGAATEVYGARPQNINIALDRLGDVTINATNITEGAAQTREIFSKQLLEVLNDANSMAGK